MAAEAGVNLPGVGRRVQLRLQVWLQVRLQVRLQMRLQVVALLQVVVVAPVLHLGHGLGAETRRPVGARLFPESRVEPGSGGSEE